MLRTYVEVVIALIQPHNVKESSKVLLTRKQLLDNNYKPKKIISSIE